MAFFKKRKKWKTENDVGSATQSGGAHETQKYNGFTKRAFLIASGQGIVISILGARLAYLQIKEGQRYATLSEENRVNVLMLAPERGQIVDRYGVPLALNIRDFRAVVIPEKASDVRAVLKKLSAYIPRTAT